MFGVGLAFRGFKVVGGLGRSLFGRRGGSANDDARRAAGQFKADTRVRGLSDLRRAMRRVDRAADEAIERQMRELATDVASRAQQRAPVRSGRLQRSIKPSVTIKRGAAVTSNVPYAKVHDGAALSARVAYRSRSGAPT